MSVMYCKFCGYKITQTPEPELCPECGAKYRQNRGNIRLPGEMIGKYRILRLIGRGGSGDVYLCDNPLLMTKCAVKVLCDDRSSHDEVFVERLLREAKIAAALQRPDVVAVLDAGVDDVNKEPFIVMEYVDGESLEDVLRDGPLPEDAVLGVATKIATVLAEAEKLGIVHRDIKPGNILLTTSGDIKLADLGIAKSGIVTGDTISDDNVLLGTPDYSSPEQLRNSQDVDIRADIYSLGATMYHMLTGSRPFASDTVFNTIAKVLETTPKPISSFQVSVSAETIKLINRMMAKNPENRIAGTAELLQALRRCTERKKRASKKLSDFFLRRAKTLVHLKFTQKHDRSVSFITPKKILRDLFLCFAVFLCLLFAWFNVGKSYSEKISKENLAGYEEMRKKNVQDLLKTNDRAVLADFLSRPETSYRSRQEIFLTLLRKKSQHSMLLRLISDDIFSAKEGEDFLGTACSVPNCEGSVVEELIRSGAEIDFRDRNGRTPLMKALLSGNSEAANTLLEYGADTCLIDNEGRNILSYLPAKFSREMLENLLETDVPVNVADRRGLTPLMIYVDRFDSPEMVQLMIDKKFNINRKSHNGETPLAAAIRRRHIASAEILFKNRARFDASLIKKVPKEYRLRNWMKNKLEKGK